MLIVLVEADGAHKHVQIESLEPYKSLQFGQSILHVHLLIVDQSLLFVVHHLELLTEATDLGIQLRYLLLTGIFTRKFRFYDLAEVKVAHIVVVVRLHRIIVSLVDFAYLIRLLMHLGTAPLIIMYGHDVAEHFIVVRIFFRFLSRRYNILGRYKQLDVGWFTNIDVAALRSNPFIGAYTHARLLAVRPLWGQHKLLRREATTAVPCLAEVFSIFIATPRVHLLHQLFHADGALVGQSLAGRCHGRVHHLSRLHLGRVCGRLLLGEHASACHAVGLALVEGDRFRLLHDHLFNHFRRPLT